METSEVKTLKGAVHLALAIVPLVEARIATSKTRALICGLAAGWHLNAAFYHFFIEKGKKSGRKTKL
jgi:hypothetical protein